MCSPGRESFKQEFARGGLGPPFQALLRPARKKEEVRGFFRVVHQLAISLSSAEVAAAGERTKEMAAFLCDKLRGCEDNEACELALRTLAGLLDLFPHNIATSKPLVKRIVHYI